MAIEGDLRDITISSFVQVLCIERRKTTLIVRRRGEEGAVFFDDGEIVHAAVGDCEGAEALYRLLTWSDGSFHTNDQIMAPGRTIGVSWNNLLLEGMRRIDEQARARAGYAPGADTITAQEKQPFSPADIEHDNNYEAELILMLSKLELFLIHLGEHRAQKEPAQALQSLAELVNQIIEFFENIPEAYAMSGSLVKALTRVADLYPQTRLLGAQYNRLRVSTVVTVYQNWAEDPNDRRYLFRQICYGMMQVAESYFSLFATYFRDPDRSDQWRETYGVFLTDLRRAVDKVPF
ncbi:MAG TPA: DUF4388 domain-containing protein [Blastocatellia bacterium]|nr:DUF4388 domain-containing protein [Blastocatellia bacterium]